MKTLTGTDNGIVTTATFPEDHKDKRTAASLEAAAQRALDNDKAIKNKLDGPVMQEDEDVALLGSQSAPGRGYVPMSDGSGGLEWVPRMSVIDEYEGESIHVPGMTTGDGSTIDAVISLI